MGPSSFDAAKFGIAGDLQITATSQRHRIKLEIRRHADVGYRISPDGKGYVSRHVAKFGGPHAFDMVVRV